MKWNELTQVKEENIDLIVIWLKTDDNAQLQVSPREIGTVYYPDRQVSSIREAIIALANEGLSEAKRFGSLRNLKRK